MVFDMQIILFLALTLSVISIYSYINNRKKSQKQLEKKKIIFEKECRNYLIHHDEFFMQNKSFDELLKKYCPHNSEFFLTLLLEEVKLDVDVYENSYY